MSSADLERQVGRVAEECGTRGITLAATITEIGSGVFGNRAKRQKLPDGAVSVVRAAYRFALDPTPRSRTWCLRSHCGGQRYAFYWGLGW